MRADRLVATLLLLQSRGTVTAAEVAEELEISVRTARRDLDALAMAGVPIYSQRGRGGGWQLLGGATTDLTGLRSPEARALMTMAAAAGQATPEFGSAMQKLMQALPEPIRAEAQQAVSSVLADSTAWGNAGSLLHERTLTEWIEPLQQAVIVQREVTLTYNTPRKGVSERTVQPLGLVVKQGRWYLLANTAAGMRSFRVDRVMGVEATTGFFERPESFDLQAEWERITISYTERSSTFRVQALVDHEGLGPLRAQGVETVVGKRSPDGRRHVTLGAWRADVLAAKVAGLMRWIELVDPPDEFTELLAQIGRELVEQYG